MVTLFGGGWRFDEVIVDHQIRIPLVGLAAEEAVEAIESLRQRPLGAVAARRDVLDGNVVILADPIGAEPVVLQYLADGGAFCGQSGGGAWEPVGTLGD